QVYQYLMAFPAGGGPATPDAAESCSFTQPTEYTCKLKAGQKFSNGDPLTAQDVVFSYQREVKINDPNGAASLLANMKSVAAPDDMTVVFTLNNANDQTWPFILGTDAGPIVDSKVYPADKLLPDDKTVGSGPYKITSYNKNQLVQLEANPNYAGANKPKTGKIAIKYYTSGQNLKLDIQSGAIDIAYRSLSATDIESLKSAKDTKIVTGPGGELRYIVFNFKTMPGDTDAQKRAIRRAVAYSVDRQALSDKVYKGTYKPAFSMIPDGVTGHIDAFKDEFGAAPDKAKATAELQQAGVKTPVSLNIEYAIGHYGPSSDQEYNEVKRQLEGTGLFKVKLQSTEWDTYSDERVKDAYPIYQLGWFPDFPDADDYLSPFLVEDNFVHAHYCDPKATNRPCDSDKMSEPLKTEETTTGGGRTAAFEQIQKTLATGQLPYLPLLEGEQVAITHGNVTGVDQTLDPSFLFRTWLFSKS
ncbi:MAG TPA: ABC transporter substrate-binding protein, partial [Jatrophihabitantaceae bacterium]|nr:ABC transporter substrate-binding protein [Jatrophihabitantaceae bacterium]